MVRNKLFLAAFILIFYTGACVNKNTSVDIPRSVPEAEGVSSKGILNFLDAVEKSSHEFHSFMFLRHGRVIAEGWWDPYRPGLKHTMYSASKSFTSTAVGFAVSENLLSVNDKVISFFPGELPDSVSPYLSELTVKDVITMSVGQDPDPTAAVVSNDSNWVKSFLSLPIVNKPGSRFLYNTLGTYMLSAIVQKVTGEKIIDYLRPRLFEPLGIQGMDWEVDPKGINTGGWGLRVKTEDLAKFGQFYLQKGKWNGKQLLPEAWIDEATTGHIEQGPDFPQSVKDSSDWLQRYGYQFWRCRHNAYRGDGAFGQYIIVMPEKDAVIAITSETPNMQSAINLVWEYLLPSIQADPLPADDASASALKTRLTSLSLPIPEKGVSSPVENQVSGKIFTMDPNEKNMESIALQFNDSLCELNLKTSTTAYTIEFASGRWKAGETTKHGPYLLTGAKAKFVGLPPFKVVGCYRWKDEKTLELTLRYIESPHTETMILQFDQDKISVETRYSFSYNAQNQIMKGEIKK